ncbi:hypothetical protein [Pararhodobacter oceanensis]|uniref:Uncharacterized protein n=1 Tax=Pararhodobacter oceanensis TaxID=2172121 RepID=A0A2T8HWV3_9RHOB|nr:hypothetical protein [Pararhodobacter oceanensis]PVH29909.1 hypothetical protein DDE20_07390 [Pararhodobacter oceanensis]
MIVLSIVLVTLPIGVVLGGILVRVISAKAALWGAVLLLIVAAALWGYGATLEEMDALDYTMPALILFLPIGLGMALVALLAIWGQRRR